MYKYLIEYNILYSKQFGFQGFQNGHSTGHAVVQLADQIIQFFKYNKNALGEFKAFNTVDHSILFKNWNYMV